MRSRWLDTRGWLCTLALAPHDWSVARGSLLSDGLWLDLLALQNKQPIYMFLFEMLPRFVHSHLYEQDTPNDSQTISHEYE